MSARDDDQSYRSGGPKHRGFSLFDVLFNGYKLCGNTGLGVLWSVKWRKGGGVLSLVVKNKHLHFPHHKLYIGYLLNE